MYKVVVNTLKFLLSLVLFGCCLPFLVQAQDVGMLKSLVPPSPNAASLGKFGGINAGLSSGAVNTAVPLTEFKAGRLRMPISINYTSNGFKVDEIASRVGTGWRLNAGGVITRTLYGALDEYSNALWNDPTYSSSTGRQFVTFLNKITGQEQGTMSAEPYTQNDGQPDIFNFNFGGHTGQFIIKPVSSDPDGQRNFEVVQLNYTGLKIETRLRRSPADFLFKITSEDGIQYFFNDVEMTTNNLAIIPNLPFGSCSSLESYSAVPSAFYLTKIVHPNGEVINLKYNGCDFKYPTGVSESIYHADPSMMGTAICNGTYVAYEDLNNILCTNTLSTAGVVLKEISSSVTGKIVFDYISRLDYNDSLLTSIKVYPLNQSSYIKKFSFNYQNASNRPFLTNITEFDANSLESYRYQFTYNSLDQIPPILSFSQDHWGYFNGKSNSTLIPTPTDERYKYYLPSANANREPNSHFCQAGVLSSITYPTGGKDTIYYEANESYKQVTIPANPTSISVSGNGTSWPNAVYSSNAVVNYKQKVTFSSTCDENTQNPDDPVIQVSLINTATNTEVYNLSPNYGQTVNNQLLLDPGTYQIKISVYGNADVQAVLYYCSGSPTTQLINANAGGIRVAKIVTTDPITATTKILKYKYTLFNDPTKSSASDSPSPTYEDYDFSYFNCKEDGLLGCGYWLKKGYFAMHANSLYNLFVNSFNTVTYANVTELIGENGEGGMIQHQFTSVPNTPGIALMGKFIIGTPYLNNSLLDGKEIYTGIFKKTSSGYVPVKKTYVHYNDDLRKDSLINGYSASRNYDFCPQATGVPSDEELQTYNLTLYGIPSKWIYVDTSKVQSYDAAGALYTEEKEYFEYDNVSKPLISKYTKIDSKNNVLSTTYKYPYDNLSLAPYNSMVYAHIISPRIEEILTKNNNFLYSNRIEYKDWGNGIYMPEIIASKQGSNNYDIHAIYNSYNSAGNPTSFSQNGGPNTAYIWGYNNQYPIAEVKGAKVNEVYDNNFEEATDFPDWGVTKDDSRSHTGHCSGRITNTGGTEMTCHSNTWLQINQQGVARRYHYSGWVYSDGPSVDILLYMKRPGESGDFTYVDFVSTNEKGKWVYLEKDYDVPADVTQLNLRIDNNGKGSNGNSNVWFDDLRLYPSDGQMYTYTYDPLIGMTSAMDPKGQTTYYEYDGFQRLYRIKDQHGNIVKQYCYNYAGHATDCSVPIVTGGGQAIYARVEVNNIVQNSYSYQTYSYYQASGDIYIKLYSDEACTQPYTLTSNLTVDVTETYTELDDINYSYTPVTSTYTLGSGSSSYFIKNIMFTDDAEWTENYDDFHSSAHDYSYQVVIHPNSNYIPGDTQFNY